MAGGDPRIQTIGPVPLGVAALVADAALCGVARYLYRWSTVAGNAREALLLVWLPVVTSAVPVCVAARSFRSAGLGEPGSLVAGVALAVSIAVAVAAALIALYGLAVLVA